MTKSDSEKDDLRQIGVSAASQATLDELQRNKLIGDQMDGYRLAVATAIAFGRSPRDGHSGSRQTKYAASGVDPDQELKTVIAEIYPEHKGTPYRAIEDLAEQGLEIIKDRTEGDSVWYGDLVASIESANSHGPPKET